jgi:adenylate cyclase
VRVTAQVIRVSDGFHLWSNTYDRSMDDVFAIQDDISSNVANALKIVLDENAWQRMQAAGVRNVDAFIEFQKGRELFGLAHGGGDLMLNLREGLVHFDRAIEIVPDFAAAYWEKSDYYAHVLLEPTSTDEEKTAALLSLREVLELAHRFSGDSTRRAFIDVDQVLFSDDWTPLHDRIEKALETTDCPDPTWIEVATGIGYAEAAFEMFRRYQRCEPLSSTAPLKLADTAFWQENYEQALEILDEGEILLGSNAWFAGTRQRVLLAMGRSEDALAIAADVSVDQAFFGMSAEALPLALSGDTEAARAAMERWRAEFGRNLRNELEINAATGNRERANELAAEIDAGPGGPMLLLVAAVYCACGAPFDLESTPNFRDRLMESGTHWPLQTHIHYPAKDW